MANEPQEITAGYTGFRPEDFVVPCDGCGNPLNLLENHLRAALHVERVIPFFDPEAMGGATSGKLGGRDEGGKFHNAECLVKRTQDQGLDKSALPMYAHVEDEYPYGEDTEEFQKISETHNKRLKREAAKAKD